MASYIWESLHRAFNKSWSKLGMAVNLLLSAIAILAYFIVRRPTPNEIFAGELVLAIWILLAVYVVTFFIYFIWEVQFVFPRIKLEKRNTREGTHIVIWNNEILDLTDVDVELFERKWISKDGNAVRIPIDPQNRLFDLGNETKVSYDGGVQTVLLASAVRDDATFHLRKTEIDTGHEYYNGAQHSIYDITVRVKGKIGGRTIHPQKLQGRLKYTRGEPHSYVSYVGDERRDPEKYSKMEWETLA